MRVLSVASECFPLVKTGGLADVVGALPAALAPLGVEMRVLLPGYPAVLAALWNNFFSRAKPLDVAAVFEAYVGLVFEGPDPTGTIRHSRKRA